MKAGPELDALIAEKVMGWTLEESQYEYGVFRALKNPLGYIAGLFYVSGPCVEMAGGTGFVPQKTDSLGSCSLPAYSRDISAALEVVRKLVMPYQITGHSGGVDIGKWVDFHLAYAALYDNPWRATFEPHNEVNSVGTEYWQYDGEGDTPALAICLAALKFVESK